MDTPLIDAATFAELQDATGADFVAELVGTFSQEAPALIREMQAAFTTAEVDSFRRAAHSLKSNAQTFGATRLAEQARALELGGLPDDAHLLEALSAELALTIVALRERCGG